MEAGNSDKIFNFDHSYFSLPEIFYSRVEPTVVPSPQMVIFNDELSSALDVQVKDKELLPLIMSGNKLPENSVPLAQAYAGHQFGYFTMLGDGRAILLGEHVTPGGERYDIQLKGAGTTPYSRSGDGKATLRAMLREYLFSEAIHYLGIPTSRSLAVVATGETVRREAVNRGAVLTRVMKSHIRVGTFEFARHFGTREDLLALTDYTIARHFPELADSENPALLILDKVMRLQIELVVQWMRVGFIHGVMNTDNTSIAGETFDYGPCAFMNTFHTGTVFSSIDHSGRYSFGNQPEIIKWNIAKLAQALLPAIHSDEKIAIESAVQKIDQFDGLFTEAWYKMMLGKIGIDREVNGDRALVDELLSLMQANKMDYTNTFLSLFITNPVPENSTIESVIKDWLIKWKERVSGSNGREESAKKLMKKNNPVFVPRNIHIEEALNMAVQGDFTLYNRLLNAFRLPYEYRDNLKNLLTYDKSFDRHYQTFCGT